MPLVLRPGGDPLRSRGQRVLSLQEEIVALLAPTPRSIPARESVTTGLVVPRDECEESPGPAGPGARERPAALDRAAARLALELVGEPRETVSASWEGVVLPMTADGRRP